MAKKTASNVPASSSAISASNGTNNHNGASSSRRPHSTSSSSSHSGNSPFVNAKHLHAPLHPHKSKQSRDSDAATRATSSENILMKKLFEAVQKHKVVPEHEREPQQRQNPQNPQNSQKNQQQNLQQNQQQKNQKKKPLKKPSVPASPARPINSSENYAGAAFDRAPAATSFPVPSFASSTSSVLSSSCPSDAFSLQQQETKTTVCFSGSSSSKLRALSVSELFKTEPSTDPQKQNLDAVTSDLRKLLNLGKI